MLPVHLYGQVAPMEAVAAAADGLVVVEDAAQAHGARRHGRPVGSWGLAAGFSFYPGKNLGAYGDGGAVVTDDDDVATALDALRNHGSRARYEHPTLGFNSRLDTLQAVVLKRSCHVSTNGTPPAGGRLPATRSCSVHSPACGSLPHRPATSPCGTSTWCAWPSGTAAWPRWQRPESPSPSTIRRRSI